MNVDWISDLAKALVERRFSISSLSLFRFHLSPFPPETPVTQARVNVKVEPRSTYTFTMPLLLLTHVKITRQWKFTFDQKNVPEFLLYFLPLKFAHLNNTIINPTLTFSDCLPCQSPSYFFPPLPRLFPFSRFLMLFWATLRRKELWCHGECVWRVRLLSRQAPREVTQTQPLIESCNIRLKRQTFIKPSS